MYRCYSPTEAFLNGFTLLDDAQHYFAQLNSRATFHKWNDVIKLGNVDRLKWSVFSGTEEIGYIVKDNPKSSIDSTA